MQAVDIRVLLSLVPRPEENEPENEAKHNNMILLAHWFAGVSGMQLQPQNQFPLSIALHHNCTLELHYKELVASSSSDFILNFDICSYVEVPDSQNME